MIARSENSISVEVSTNQTLPFTPYFEVKSHSRVSMKYVKDVVKFVDLLPYQKVEFSISTCFKTARQGEYICGDYVTGETTSNTAGNMNYCQIVTVM